MGGYKEGIKNFKLFAFKFSSAFTSKELFGYLFE
jgi:hypothetical protein